MYIDRIFFMPIFDPVFGEGRLFHPIYLSWTFEREKGCKESMKSGKFLLFLSSFVSNSDVL